MKLLFTTAASLILSQSVNAQETTALWQNFTAGDSPAVVIEKLRALPEIKNAELKDKAGEPRISIKYAEEGFVINSENFKVTPIFENGMLSKINLGTKNICANKPEEQLVPLTEALRLKFPTNLQETLETGDLYNAKFKATDRQPSFSEFAMTDGKTVALISTRFNLSSDPSPIYSSDETINTLNNLQEILHFFGSRKCKGDGDRSMRINITYMPIAEYNAGVAEAKLKQAAQQEKAKEIAAKL